jgi:hypothetical protein
MKILIGVLWVMTPCSLIKNSQHFRGICCLHFKTERMATLGFSGTLVTMCKTTQCYNAEEHSLNLRNSYFYYNAVVHSDA